MPGEYKQLNIDKSQCGLPEVGLDCKNFRRVIIREYVTIRQAVRDRGVAESDKFTTTVCGRAYAPDGGIAYELKEG